MNRRVWHLILVRPVAAMLAVLVCLMPLLPRASAQSPFASPGDSSATHHTGVKLLLSAAAAQPGTTIWAGIDLNMEPGWHTYWKNAGDAGTPTKVIWTLPTGLSAGEIQWPIPQKLPPAEVTTYGYEGEAVLLVPLILATNLAPGTLSLSARVSWLECKDSCIPADALVTATIKVAAETEASTDAALIEQAKMRLPATGRNVSAFAWWEKTATNDIRVLNLAWHDKSMAEAPDFFPDGGDDFEIQPATELVAAGSADAGDGNIHLRKVVNKLSGDWPRQISGLLTGGTGRRREGLAITLPVADEPPLGRAITSAASTSSALPAPPLWQMLVYAFIGGLILNIMPCVLPVIALKILGFVGEAQSKPRRVRFLGLIYALGVLVSFLALAGMVIGIRAAGHHAGWGMQFGSPIFIVCLTTLVLLVALNLFGVFEVTLGGQALDAASNLASRSGSAGAFLNGVLATTLATPCTAPFLAPALGFAFAQSAPIILLVFLTVGLGLATPYLILSSQPAWLKFLPKPGSWMEKFKIAMGFPMLATVLWLYSIAAGSYGKNVLYLGVFLVATALSTWIFGEFVQRGRHHKFAATVGALLAFAVAYGVFLEKNLNWRAPVTTNGAGDLQESADDIAWRPWTPEAVATARAAGRPVLVDFTADWCLTCQVNRKTSLEVASVREKLKTINALALVGDYTHFPEAITAELNRYQRAGVPLVLVYPKDPAAPAIVLPSVLTPGMVLTALDQAR